MKTPGDLIKELRMKYKLSRRNFGLKVGVTTNMICMLENNNRKPGIELCYRLCDMAASIKMKITLQDLRPREKC